MTFPSFLSRPLPFLSLLTAATLFLLPPNSEAINVSLSAGPVGTVYPTSFFQQFTEANGQPLDGSTLNLDFIFDNNSAFRFDYAGGSFARVILIDIKLWHNLGSFIIPSGPDAANLVRLNGTGGSPNVEVSNFNFSGTGRIDGSNSITVAPMIDDPDVTTGYTFTGVTMNLVLPTEAASITSADISIIAYEDSSADFTVVPEPFAPLLLLLATTPLFFLRHRRHSSPS
ncbi:MAG: hypothetical protein AAF591_07350 [Verrucomicrobiota bacterium]